MLEPQGFSSNTFFKEQLLPIDEGHKAMQKDIEAIEQFERILAKEQ